MAEPQPPVTSARQNIDREPQCQTAQQEAAPAQLKGFIRSLEL
ncbi:hypothetical protein ACFQH2_12200 [Natronoarchaeum sp. GCM10025703]